MSAIEPFDEHNLDRRRFIRAAAMIAAANLHLISNDALARQAAPSNTALSNPGAHQRRCFGCVKRFRYVRERFHRRSHVFLVSTVKVDTANLKVRAGHEVSAPARGTRSVLLSVPAHADTFFLLPMLHPRTGNSALVLSTTDT